MSGLIIPHKGFVPKVDPTAFIAANATLVGDVEIAANASIWFGCILRGDGPGIRIGENSNLQDGTVVHVAARGLMTVSAITSPSATWCCCMPAKCRTAPSSACTRRCSMAPSIESEAMVAAGALIPPRKIVRRGELWAGNPARKLRDLTDKDYEDFKRVVAGYVKLAKSYDEPIAIRSAAD